MFSKYVINHNLQKSALPLKSKTIPGFSISIVLLHDLLLLFFFFRAREGKTKDAMDVILDLCRSGYSPTDVIQTLFKVTRSYNMPEPEKLEFMREIGFSHMRISEGLNTQLQLLGCITRLSTINQPK